MGSLAGEPVAAVEEHLLICSFCQSRLVETDEFLALFRTAATQVDARTVPAWKRVLAPHRPFWASVATVFAALLILLVPEEPYKTTRPSAIVLMQSLRGPEAAAHMVPGRSCLLVFDVAIHASRVNYEIEIVDAVGNQILTTGAEVKDGRLNVLIEKLARGSYWVRVYGRQADRELLAEYGLRVE